MASKDDSVFPDEPRKEVGEKFLNNQREMQDKDEISTAGGLKHFEEAKDSDSQASYPLRRNNLSRDTEAHYSFVSGSSCFLGHEQLNIDPITTHKKNEPDTIEASAANLVENRFSELHIRNLNRNDSANCVEKESSKKESLPGNQNHIIKDFAPTSKLSVDLPGQRKVKRSKLVKDGRDITDLIVGSYRAMDYLLSFYNEWVTLRTQSLSLLQQLREVIHSSCRNSKKMDDITAGLDSAARVMDNIPHPNAPIGSRIATAIWRVFSYFFTSKLSKEDLEAKQLEIRQTFQKDIDSSSSVYIFAIQCSTQFEETRQAIKSFHLTAERDDFASVQDDEVLRFLNEILEYNPDSLTVYYRRLRSCYERLIRNSDSEESRAFTRGFDDAPEAVEVVDLLPWRFDTECFDNTVVNDAWKGLFGVFNSPEPFDVKRFLPEIENCLFMLGKEQAILERAVIGLLIKKV